MNYFKLFVAVLASIPLVFSAAHPAASVDVVCTLDREALEQVIGEGDHPEKVAAAFRGCWQYTDHAAEFRYIFQKLVEHGMINSLESCLSRIGFPDQDTRDRFLWIILRSALFSDKRDIFEFALAQPINLCFPYHVPLWSITTWSLDYKRQLIRRHPEHAAALAPTYVDVLRAEDIDRVMELFGLAEICHHQLNANVLDASGYLTAIVRSTNLCDGDKHVILQHLIDIGAKVRDDDITFMSYYSDISGQSLQLLRHHHQLQRQAVQAG